MAKSPTGAGRARKDAGAAKAAGAKAGAAKAGPAKPPEAPAGPLGTAVQAAAELAEIGLTASGRALRRALSRLPH